MGRRRLRIHCLRRHALVLVKLSAMEIDMRNLFTTAIASLALAAVLAGTASAHVPSDYFQGDRLHSTPDQTDTNKSSLYRAPAGEIVSEAQPDSDRTQSGFIDQDDTNKPWLYRSPLGVVVSPGSDTEAAGSN